MGRSEIIQCSIRVWYIVISTQILMFFYAFIANFFLPVTDSSSSSFSGIEYPVGVFFPEEDYFSHSSAFTGCL